MCSAQIHSINDIMFVKRLMLTGIAYMIVIVSLVHIGAVLTEEAEVMVESTENQDGTVTGTLPGTHKSVETYIRLFKQHRATQLDAVKSIQKFSSSYEKQYKLVETIVQQLFKVISDSKLKLVDFGYIPGDPFPENDTIREALSKVLENTALFGDLILRLPDITHAVYKNNKEWEFLIGWAVWTAMESKIFQGADAKMLNLMSQELGLIPKEEDYVNPYREEESLKKMESQQRSDQDKKKKSKEKKKVKEKRKGPRLSGASHTEL